MSQSKFKEAELTYRECLTFLKEYPSYLSSRFSIQACLSQLLLTVGKYEESEKLSRENIQPQEAKHERDHPDSLISLETLAGAVHSITKGNISRLK